MSDNGSGENISKYLALNTKNEKIEVTVRKCDHCNEMVPIVEICSGCKTAYKHTNTVENPDTGFIHFVYECSGCPPDKRKAQKIIKIYDGNDRVSSDNLIKDFL